MPTRLREIISVSLVLLLDKGLLSEADQLQTFQHEVDVDFRQEVGMAANVTTGETHPNRVLHLDRHRISLNLSPGRSSITREFPLIDTLDRDLGGFAEIANHALNATGLHETTCDFGYNAEMVFDQDANETALEFIGQRLLRHDVLDQTGRHLVGGNCRIIVRDESGQWTYSIEPRAGDLQRRRVFVGTNLHKVNSVLPNEGEISSSLKEVVNSVQDLMCRLDN